MTNIIVSIDSSDQEHLYKTNKFLRKYLGGNFNVKLNMQGSCIELSPLTEKCCSDDVEKAMENYVKTLGRSHGGCRFKYEINSMKVSEREILEKEIRKEYDSKIIEMRADQARLEAKWAKDRLKYQDDINGMRERESELKLATSLLNKESERLETVFYDYKFELLEEQILSDNLDGVVNSLSSDLVKTHSELETVRNEYEKYIKTPLYKLFFNKIKDAFK